MKITRSTLRFISTLSLALAFHISIGQTISLIGPATPAGNWDVDFNMTQDPGNPLQWTMNLSLTDGVVKFRQDGSWAVNWGGTEFPTGTAIPDGDDIPVTAGNYNITFNTGEPSYEFLLNTSYGNVGIGTASPQEKLDVQGNIRFSGELKPGGVSGATGQVLQSNGNGTMGWANNSSSGNSVTSANGSVGYGTWGDCEMQNVSQYNPISDTAGQAQDYFGTSVAISGDFAIIGANGDDESTASNQGSANIYRRNSATGTWEFYQELLNASPAEDDYFGYSVDISGDFAIVGSPGDGINPGDAYGSASIFKRNSTSGIWEFQSPKLFNSDASAFDNFGLSVSISGDYAVVGSAYDDGPAGLYQGSASIFKRNSSTGVWELQGSKILDPDPGGGDYFGTSVCIHGDYIIIGAPYDDDASGTDQGSARIMKRNETTEVWEFQGNKLFNPDAEASELFGYSVGISGNQAIIGSPWDNDQTYSFQWGSAVILKRNEITNLWDLQGSKITNPGAAGDHLFGTSVMISGNLAIIGAGLDDIQGNNSGSATIYINTGSFWQKMQKIHDPAGLDNERFGSACDIDGSNGRFIIGAYGAGNSQGKVVFGKVE